MEVAVTQVQERSDRSDWLKAYLDLLSCFTVLVLNDSAGQDY